MANSNGGAKFLPSNLNKSYGPSGHANSSTNGGGYGPGRGRVGGYGGKLGGVGSGGGGMVVLSRPRSGHKAQPKLSVPPPLNLPSLRKEQRFDILGSGTGSVAGGAPGIGTRPATSGVGWSKPSSSATGSEEREGASLAQPLSSESSEHKQLNLDGSNKSGIINPYSFPSLIPVSAGRGASVSIIPDKTLNLRGEDFPSLKATLVTTNGSVQKQKDGLLQKQLLQGSSEELSTMKKDGSHLSSQIDMHPRFQPSQLSLNRSSEHGSSENRSLNSSQLPESVRRHNDYFPGPLPLVSLNLRSDWADDERDVSHGFTERARANHSYSKTDPYLEKGFDFPRGSILQDKLSQNHFNQVDSFSSDPFGVVKRKKDVGKQIDFHDPIRESFEAELKRVQKMQEQERQHIIEEQERAMEMAFREEEEKQRVAREQEEHRIRLEEEAREVSWREEQEKLQSIRRAEELKIAREEEKKRMMMEEERRKQAARQKLQELEEKIARRQAEAAKADGPIYVADERTAGIPKDNTDDLKELPEILDAREEIAKIECQDLKGSSACRCDSQSSISVSSPPHSPTHISHADFDESGDYPLATTSPESNEIYPPENVSAVLSTKSRKESLATDFSSVPVDDDDDDDWPTIRNEELQQQEEYDEDNDGYYEDEEVLVRDDENAELSRELDGLCLEVKDSPAMTENMVLGFDQGVEVGIISDEYESNPLKKENMYVAPPASAGIVQKPVSFDGRKDDGPTLRFGNDSHAIISGSLGVIQEMKSTFQDSVAHPVSHASSSPEPLNSANATSGRVVPDVQPVPTSIDNALYSSWPGPAVVSSNASEQSPSETPVRLQFGLFSGPSVIPSPITSIQIGSIRMPFQLHPHVGPSLTHMHSQQPPLFQFGQLRYPSPISHGPIPLAPQSMSFNPPNVPTTYTLNQNPSPPVHLFQGGTTSGFGQDNSLMASMGKQISDSPKLSSSQVIVSKEANSEAGGQRTENNNLAVQQTCRETSNSIETVSGVEYSKKTEFQRSQCSNTRSNSSISVAGASEGLLRARFQGKGINGPPPIGPISGNKGRRYSFIAKNPGQKPSSALNEASGFDTNGFQRKPRRGVRRMEFRVRRSADKRLSSTSLTSNQPVIDMNADNQQDAECFSRGSFNHRVLPDRYKQTIDSGSNSSKQVNYHGISAGINTFRGNEKDASAKNSSRSGESSLKRNISSEYDVDAPLQSGIVRIFNQPGIEVPSDENDFIEVRSKRQMLNNRREQREKEIKANSNKNKKVVRKHSAIPPTTPATFSKVAMSLNREVPNATYARANQKQGMVHGDASTGFSKVSLPLAPIGTPRVNPETPANGRSDNAKSTVEPSCVYESKKESLDGAPTSLVSWSSQHNHEVMPLTQSQFDEAMKPAQFNVTPISDGHLTRPVSKPHGSASSMLLKDNSFQAATSPINSLLAGEKIQFGAVTSPTVFPPASDEAVSHNVRSTASQLRSDLQNSQRAGDISLFKIEKQAQDSSFAHLQDCEAEARAAASAVAAISNDEAAGNGNSTSVTDSKKYRDTACGHETTSELKAKELLSVSLPADLSVETPISIWPPLPSPQSSSSSQMLCPFPGVTPSRLPFYDMNPVMGGPVFAYGPPDEAVSSQSQLQKSSSSGPGPGAVPLSSWQQCLSGMDSFYGPPAGYPGGIAGAQGPTPMVIHNHFAPVGQVGLSYYGTYVPSGKPNWNHAPASGGGGSEGEMKNMNILPPQHHPLPPSMPPPAQHLGPRSPLLSTPSPMAMFDVFPFQSSTNMAVPAHWSHGPPPLHSILPQSMPLPQQQTGGGALAPPLNYGPMADNDSCAPPNRCSSNPQTPSPGEKNVDAELAAPSAHIWSEPMLVVDLQNNSSVGPKSSQSTQEQGASSSKSNMQPKRLAGGHQYNQPRGLGPSSQKSRGAGAEWSNNRKIAFHGRSHSSGGERGGFIPGKMKQIYVAKRASGDGASTTAS